MLISIGVDALGMVPKGLEKRLGELKIRERMKTIQTTALLSRILKKNSKDLSRLAVTETSVKNYQLKLKTCISNKTTRN